MNFKWEGGYQHSSGKSSIVVSVNLYDGPRSLMFERCHQMKGGQSQWTRIFEASRLIVDSQRPEVIDNVLTRRSY
jgi:hypothetical protein